jgi:hypothetical protein
MSVASGNMNDVPYALFGGFNSSQVLDGDRGLVAFKNNRGDYKS